MARDITGVLNCPTAEHASVYVCGDAVCVCVCKCIDFEGGGALKGPLEQKVCRQLPSHCQQLMIQMEDVHTHVHEGQIGSDTFS